MKGQRIVCVFNPDDPLEEWDSNLPRRFTFERISNSQGIANFERLTPGPWKVSIETRGDPVEGDFTVYEGETAELTLVIPVEDLVDNSGVLAGTIRFEDGTPAERTRIRAELQGDKENVEAGSSGMAQTDQEGKFRIRGLRQKQPFKLEIRARRASQDHEGVMTTNRELEYILPNSGGISAQVVATDGQPPTALWNATLYHLEDGRSRPVFEPPETLQSLGMVSWENLGQGTYQILVTGPEIARAYSELIDVLPDELTDGIEIRVPESVEFSGEVVDTETGKGIPGVEVIELFEEGSIGARWSQSSYQRRVFTDAVGDFLMMGLPPGSIRLRLEHSAYESGTYEAEEITNREETIVLQKISLSE